MKVEFPFIMASGP